MCAVCCLAFATSCAEPAPTPARPVASQAAIPAPALHSSTTERDDATAPVVTERRERDASDRGSQAAALPKKCAADSPADEPCATYGGTYRVRLTPRPSASESCFVKKPIEALVTVNGTASYRGVGQAEELRAFGKALGLRNPELRLGADVRDGVCCVDLDVSDQTAKYRRVVVHLARGASVVIAKAKERATSKTQFCDEELDVTAELVPE
jgi:hypothetical protein